MDFSVIPRPHSLKLGDGVLALTSSTCIGAPAAAERVAAMFSDRLYRMFGYNVPISAEDEASILFTIDPQAAGKNESYTLSVTKGRAVVSAAGVGGLFNGSQTLLQLFSPEQKSWPCVEIEDAPLMSWRGLMLDSARHFQPVTFIKKFLDVMALHKYNILHWHLTEDQGWRIEIEAFPKLIQAGAWRRRTGDNDQIHGGFYTKAEIRDIVAYAADRNITVVPEIEMPGHAQAALAAFPELSCRGLPLEVSTLWGVREDVYCAGNEAVFTFIETVLDEVLSLFPSRYIHIGGDECPKARWKECPRCQKRMNDLGIGDEHELQSWFIRRIERYLNQHDRRLIGWDEILEGGLAPGATVMSWRGEAGGIAAARAGHDVVMTPVLKTYLDMPVDESDSPLCGGYETIVPMSEVYGYRPIPSVLDGEAARHVLGSQGQLWTEHMPRPDRVEYMAYPRACALAEVVWGTAAPDDYAEFLNRLKAHLPRLDRLNVNYRPLDE